MKLEDLFRESKELCKPILDLIGDNVKITITKNSINISYEESESPEIEQNTELVISFFDSMEIK